MTYENDEQAWALEEAGWCKRLVGFNSPVGRLKAHCSRQGPHDGKCKANVLSQNRSIVAAMTKDLPDEYAPSSTVAGRND